MTFALVKINGILPSRTYNSGQRSEASRKCSFPVPRKNMRCPFMKIVTGFLKAYYFLCPNEEGK